MKKSKVSIKEIIPYWVSAPYLFCTLMAIFGINVIIINYLVENIHSCK